MLAQSETYLKIQTREPTALTKALTSIFSIFTSRNFTFLTTKKPMVNIVPRFKLDPTFPIYRHLETLTNQKIMDFRV